MKRYFLYLAVMQSCFFVNVNAAEVAQLHECPDGTETFDIEKIERLPFNGSGTKYEFKFPSGTYSITVNEEKRQLRIAEEISTIIKAVSGDVLKMAAEEELCASYTQKYKRSTIKITALDKDKKVDGERRWQQQ